MESVEDIRKELQKRRPATAKEQAEDTAVYRPIHRPPMARVCILDDGGEEGEWVRLRQEKTVIGRSDGDICVPHDSSMSSHHASITRVVENGRISWLLEDLGSYNGTFVRISGTIIKHGAELLVGSRRFRFDGPSALAAAADSQDGRTRAWQSVSPTDLVPSLVELTPDGDGPRSFLSRPDIWIGRDPRHATLVFTDDLLLSPRHARLHRDQHGVWHLENAGSRNGTWLRTDHITIDRICQFQLGEQRFLFKIV